MATKEQERKSLEKIKTIVKELGEDSYVGTALDGALSLAEENIDCDAAFSARYYQEALFDTEKKFRAAEQENKSLIKRLDDLKEKSDNEYEAICKKLLSNHDAEMIKKLLSEKTSALQMEVDNAAARIVEFADRPTSADFNNAVNDHRTAQQELKKFTDVLMRVCEINISRE